MSGEGHERLRMSDETSDDNKKKNMWMRKMMKWGKKKKGIWSV